METRAKSEIGLKPKIELRLMQAGDAKAVSILQSELDFSSWNQSQWLEALGHYPRAWVLEAALENRNQIIGYVIYQTRVPQVELLNIGIVPHQQGLGLAKNLLLSTIELLPDHSESIFLEVRRSNIPAIGLYENPDLILLDIRKHRAYEKEHMANAIHADYFSQDFHMKLAELDQDKPYVGYCKSGKR